MAGTVVSGRRDRARCHVSKSVALDASARRSGVVVGLVLVRLALLRFAQLLRGERVGGRLHVDYWLAFDGVRNLWIALRHGYLLDGSLVVARPAVAGGLGYPDWQQHNPRTFVLISA